MKFEESHVPFLAYIKEMLLQSCFCLRSVIQLYMNIHNICMLEHIWLRQSVFCKKYNSSRSYLISCLAELIMTCDLDINWVTHKTWFQIHTKHQDTNENCWILWTQSDFNEGENLTNKKISNKHVLVRLTLTYTDLWPQRGI